jgi:hypothetical protein
MLRATVSAAILLGFALSASAQTADQQSRLATRPVDDHEMTPHKEQS